MMLNFEDLKQLSRCPAYYDYYVTNDLKKTDTQVLDGYVRDKFLLDEEINDCEEYAILPPTINRRTKAGKIEYAEFLESNQLKTIISDAQATKATGMVDALVDYQPLQTILGGHVKKNHYISAHINDVTVYHDIDIIGDDFIAEVHTTSNASIDRFKYSMFERKIPLLYGLIDAIFKENDKEIPSKFYMIGVERDVPHLVGIYLMSEELKEYGKTQFVNIIEQYNKCYLSGNWDGYNSNNVSLITAPTNY